MLTHNAADAVAGSLPLFDAVLFDCDGVLVDSEHITCGVLRDMLAEAGWDMPLAECMRIFVGKAVQDEAQIIEARTGRPVTDAWQAEFRARRDVGLAAELEPIPGAVAAVRALHASFPGRLACASGADLPKVLMQLGKVGLLDCFGAHIFSGHDMPRSKPFPDVYLAAAAAVGADPRRCAVVEDTVTGAAAGLAAGASVFGYSPGGLGHSSALALRDAGVTRLFTRMDELPALLVNGAGTTRTIAPEENIRAP